MKADGEPSVTGGGALAAPVATGPGDPAQRYAVMDVYFGTDRRADPGAGPRGYFTADRGRELRVGVCRVSVPANHVLGNVERPRRILGFEFAEDPARHFILRDVLPLPTENYYRRLRDDVAGSGNKELLVFIHGFNVSFEGAAYRTAQIAHDLGFQGVPMMYSWPSEGRTETYTYDEASVGQSRPYLAEFLRGARERTGATRVHVLVHSMGNRALLDALDELRAGTGGVAGVGPTTAPAAPLLSQVMFTAPDVDRDVFAQAVDRLRGLVERCTLYGSSEDKALALSREIHGHDRAGEGGDRLLLAPGLDSVDASGIDTSLLGHSYYGNCKPVLLDIQAVLSRTQPPRGLFPRQRGAVGYWTVAGP